MREKKKKYLSFTPKEEKEEKEKKLGRG